jgi:hypothetical protein
VDRLSYEAGGKGHYISTQTHNTEYNEGFEVSRSVFTARFKKVIILVWCVFFKLCMEFTLHCNHRYGHLKTEPTESLLLL